MDQSLPTIEIDDLEPYMMDIEIDSEELTETEQFHLVKFSIYCFDCGHKESIRNELMDDRTLEQIKKANCSSCGKLGMNLSVRTRLK